MDLSIIILNWNTCDLLQQCLKAITETETEIALEIIVVDNASEDGSRKMVQSQFPKVNLVANPKNLGFCEGNNVGVPHTKGRYILFLNSDTVPKPGAFDRLVRFADANPDTGILGPKLLNEDGSLQYSCRRYPNLLTGFFRNTPLGRLLPKNRFAADYLMKEFDHAAPKDVDWVSGAALMIRRSLLDRIGAFDPDYYMFCEDVDICWRANHTPLDPAVSPIDPASRRDISVFTIGQEDEKPQGTWRVTYVADAEIFHYIGKSTDKAPTRMTYIFHRSQYLFYRKRYLPYTPLWVRPIIPLGIFMRALGQMARYRINYYRRKLGMG